MNYNDYPSNSSFPHPQSSTLPDLIADSAQKLDVPRRDGQANLLASSDGGLVSQIVSNYSPQIPPEQMVSRKDGGQSQYYHQQMMGAAGSDPSYYHKNRLQNPNLNPNMAAYPQPSGSFHPSEIVPPNSRNPALLQATPNRSGGSRPVQAVAPQPRIPISESKVVEERPQRRDSREKFVVTDDVRGARDAHEKKTKKGHKTKERHSSKSSERYGHVSSVQSGDRIKLKICLKPPAESDRASGGDEEGGGSRDTPKSSSKSQQGSADLSSPSSSSKQRSEKKRKKSKTRKDSLHAGPSHHYDQQQPPQRTSVQTPGTSSSTFLPGASSSSSQPQPPTQQQPSLDMKHSAASRRPSQGGSSSTHPVVTSSGASSGRNTNKQQQPSSVDSFHATQIYNPAAVDGSASLTVASHTPQGASSVVSAGYGAQSAGNNFQQQAAKPEQLPTFQAPSIPASKGSGGVRSDVYSQQQPQQQQASYQNRVPNIPSNNSTWNDQGYAMPTTNTQPAPVQQQRQQQQYNSTAGGGPPPYADSMLNQLPVASPSVTRGNMQQQHTSMQQQQRVYQKTPSTGVGGGGYHHPEQQQQQQQQFFQNNQTVPSRMHQAPTGHYMQAPPHRQQQHISMAKQEMQQPIMSVTSTKQQVFQHQAHMSSASSSMQQMASQQQSGLYQPHSMEQNMQQRQQQQQHRFHQPQLPTAMQVTTDPLKIYTTQQQSGVMSSQTTQQQQSRQTDQMHNQVPKQEATAAVVSSQVSGGIGASMNPSQMFEQRTYTATMGHNTATPHNLPANSFVFQQQQQQQQAPPVYDVHAATGQLSNVTQQQKMMTSNQQQVSMKSSMPQQQQGNKGMHNPYFPGGSHQQQQQQQMYDQRQQRQQHSSSTTQQQQRSNYSNAPPPINPYPQASMAYNIPKNTSSSSSSHMRSNTTTSPSKKHRSSTDSRGHYQQQHHQQSSSHHQQQRSSVSQQQPKKHAGGSDWQSLMMQASKNATESLYGAPSSRSSHKSSNEHHKTPKKSKEASSSSNHPPQQQSSQRDHSESPSRHSKSKSRYVIPSISSNQNKKKGATQFVRVQFKQDLEIADIYKLKDVHYPDDREVDSFDDLVPGTKVVAKWPRNSKFYVGTIIDPNAGGRRSRDRKPVKPFQADTSSVYKKHDQSISKMDSDDDVSSTKHSAKNADDDFNAYRGLSEKIKHKRSDKQRSDVRKAKKRKNPQQGLILLDSDEEDAPPPPKKSSRIDEEKKYERRNAVESRFQQQDGVGPFNRFMAILERIFEKIDSFDPKLLNEIMSNESDDLPKRLISRSRLEELNEETIKLKNLGTLNQVPRKKLVKLLTFLVPVIRDGINLKPMVVEGKHTEEQKYNREHKLERVYCATEAALVALNIMTSPSMSKTVYIDEVMERAAQLLRKQLNNTVYPEYDPVYKLPTTGKKKDQIAHTSSRMKRAHYKGTKNRRILCLYNKLNSLLSCWVDLITIQPLTDTTILQVAPVGISPFFVENVKELQLSAIRLTTCLFARYERHRKHILDDIFESMARLPTSKRNLRSYRLNYAEEAVASSDEEEEVKESKSKKDNLQYIQMVSALILQMIQAIIQLPSPVHKHTLSEEISITEVETSNELKMVGSYDMARTTTHKFLAAFLKKCSSKSEDTDFRPLFENFLHDLLNTVNKPEWPASEMVLTVLGKLLVLTFSNKSSEMSLRVASLDYLGVVAAKLRRDALSGRSDVNTVKALMKRLEETVVVDEPEEVIDEDKPLVMDEPTDMDTNEAAADAKPSKKVSTPKKNKQPQLRQRLQCLVLGYLRNNMQADQSLSFALNFYVGQWHRDVTTEYQSFQKSGKGKEGDAAEENKQSIKCQKRKGFLLRLSQAIVMSSMSRDERDYLKWSDGVTNVMSHQEKSDRLARALGNEDATQLTRYLASYRSFSRSFDTYLSYILKVCEESAVALRTRAIKCLAEVVAVDPSIMTRDDISRGVRMSLMDSSTNVREAAVDLIGRFIILKPDLVPQYYEMLTSRILDTGVSVRKRVIRILRDLCHEHPHLPQLTDACVRMIRRVNDEDGIKKLVHEVFMKMWFTPIDDNDHVELKKKALLITDIVAANRNRGYEWIEQLFKNLIDTKVENPKVELSCRQIVDCLVQHVILFENERDMQEEDKEEEKEDEEKDGEETEGEEKEETKEKKSKSSAAPSKPAAPAVTSTTPQNLRLIATIQTLGYLAKIRPMYLVKHVMLLQPYLATKCDTSDDLSIVQGVCKILELAVPLMHRPSETFLATLEAEMMKIILTHRYRVVTTAVTCLSAIVTSFTQNYKLVWDCFQRMCNGVLIGKGVHQRNPRNLFTPVNMSQLHRALFVIGHLSKTFDFDDEILKGKIDVCVKDKVYDCIFYFCDLPTTTQNEQLKVSAVTSLGLLMIQDPDMMFRTTSRSLYKDLLANNQKSVALKVQVLQNLQIYLQTEDMKQQEAALASVKKLQQLDTNVGGGAELSITDDLNGDNIKEICDVSSGMSSSVMQLFLREVLDSFFHTTMLIRRNALHTISLTLNQGLVHPNQCVPYLIAATSDPEPVIYKEADQQLNDLSKKYSGFVHTNANAGVNMSYKLHKYIASASKREVVVRGYAEMSQLACDETAKYNKAYCSHLYQIVRSDRKHRRTFIHSLLRLFDDTVKTDLEKLIFVADNLAYFPYQTVDEPLFLMHAIEVFVSVSGSNVLQAFKEALSKCKNEEKKPKKATKTRGSDDEDDDRYSMSSSSSDSDSEEEEDDGGELTRMSSMEADAIEEFAHHSLACLLLLWLKDFLKSIYGFTDNKIHKYSPTEKNRANEKQCHRRKNETKILMQVTPASQHVLRIRKRVPYKSSEFRRAVNKQYYQLKELMNKLDPNEEDSSSDEKNEKKPTATSSSHHHDKPSTTNQQNPDEDSDRDTDGEMPKPKAPLDLIRQSTALKDRKKLRKSSHTVKYAEDTSSDDSDFKGF